MAATYGYGAIPIDGVAYRPDVVFVGGGPNVIRQASGDGFVWTIDPDAPGIDEIEIGDVMVLTSRSTGRVRALERTADAVTVVLEPVDLTDIVSEGTISIDQAIDADSIVYQYFPDRLGMLPDAEVDGRAEYLPPSLRSPRLPGIYDAPGPAPSPGAPDAIADATGFSKNPLPPATPEAGGAVNFGEWEITGTASPQELKLTVRSTGKLKGGASLALSLHDLRFESELNILSGSAKKTSVILTGLTAITIKITALAANGREDNDQLRMEFPVEMALPIPPSPATLGLPLMLTIGVKFIIKTALTGPDAQLWANGKYRVDGPLGYDGENIVRPRFVIVNSLMDSIGGLSLGPSGLVFATKFKLGAGIGVSNLYAGPYGSLTVSAGVTNGSAAGAPLKRCRKTTLEIKLGYGAEVSASLSLIDSLKRLFPKGKAKAEAGNEHTVVSRTQTMPTGTKICEVAEAVQGADS